MVTIKDSGRGMAPDRLARVFDPFVTTGVAAADRPHNASPARGGGTGLGMTVCKRLIERAGGYLIVESASDQGTRVTLAIPMATASPMRKSA